ncbi:hypothetical protein NQ317_001975 [Molorchus minor]|uniref:Mutator-like transposase domain-containing protein n=1 Tax=Molorchus minor TaxID=1323400 RepID=A0ABQ9IZB1_9CUCU|nr:hypothetical protein NQ317_001975 [Molorchus minor]
MSPSLQSLPGSDNWEVESTTELIISPSRSETIDEYDFADQKLFDEYNRIMENKLEVEVEKDMEKLSGCRIVEIDYFLKNVMNLQIRHNKRCTGGRLSISGENRCGLRSTYVFKCNVCDKELSISNEDPKKSTSIINRAAVWATLSTGSTYTHSAEFFSILDIPTISANMFYQVQRELSEVWKDSLWYSMKEAGEEEKRAALERGDIDVAGVPCITVYLDGGWSKRSYGHTYNAASGVAVIIGKHSGRLLFLGVRNKYCSICARSENVGQDSPQHVCFKNWAGSSAAMEQDIIVEGFNNSLTMHEVKYSKFIADGDSSVYAKIKEKVTYGSEVVKVECMNHVLKNYSKSLYKIKK